MKWNSKWNSELEVDKIDWKWQIKKKRWYYE